LLGQDDAVAILLALGSPELEVVGITAVAGNVPLKLTEKNARKICELAGRPDIKIYAGAIRPAIAAVVLGGTSLSGGVGSMIGTALGVLVLGTLSNGLILLRIPAFDDYRLQGAELPDPDGLLQGTGKFMRHVKLRPERAPDAAALARLITAAYRDMQQRLAAE